MQLDKENGNTLWFDAIKKELSCLSQHQVFRFMKKGENPPEGYQYVPYHWVFDVKHDGRHRARLVAGGDWTTLEKDDIYSGVVGMDIVRIGFFLGELNNLKCMAGDISSAYLHGITKEKIHTIAGSEFGDLEGCIMIIYKSLYGLKESGARWHECLSAKLRSMGFTPSRADSDLWLKCLGDHYEYIATYVDDILIWSKDPMKLMDILMKDFEMKGVGIPEYYLGGDIEFLDEHWTKENIGIGFSSKTYISNLIPKFEALFERQFKSSKTPMASDYHPKVDDSPLLSDNDASKFRSIIGSMNWLITLGRFNTFYSTNTLSRFAMAPREGHLKAVFRILSYLKTFPKGRLLFDTSYPAKVEDNRDQPNWTEFYPDAEEELPPSMPDTKGKPVRMTIYVDADHAHNLVTR